MKHLFVSYEIAKELKEKGFDEECLYYYYGGNELFSFIENDKPLWMNHNNSTFNTCCSAPLYQQVIDWLREKHNMNVYVDYGCAEFKEDWGFGIKETKPTKTGFTHLIKFSTGHKTYNEALEAAIKESLKLI